MEWAFNIILLLLLAAFKAGATTSTAGGAFDILKSVVLAAIITGIVAIMGFYASSRTALKINSDRLKLDVDLADRKAQIDRDLAEFKAKLDRDAELQKRQRSVAEEVLAAVYGVRRSFEIVRSPMVWAYEMVEEEGVPEAVRRDEGYAVRRRLRAQAPVFDALEAKRHAYAAVFGPDAVAPFAEIIRLHNGVAAAGEAIQRHNDAGMPAGQEAFIRQMRRNAFAGFQLDEAGAELPDRIGSQVDEVVKAVEDTCAHVLAP